MCFGENLFMSRCALRRSHMNLFSLATNELKLIIFEISCEFDFAIIFDFQSLLCQSSTN